MLTQEAYLERERKAEFKNEFYRGEIFAMFGASRWHVRITSNLSFALMKALEGSDCLVFNSDLRVHSPALSFYT